MVTQFLIILTDLALPIGVRQQVRWQRHPKVVAKIYTPKGIALKLTPSIKLISQNIREGDVTYDEIWIL